MKLRSVRVKEFRSVWDSNSFEIDRVACLVGKNEAGKTAILQALYRLNPIIPSEGEFNLTYDYPKSEEKITSKTLKASADWTLR